MVEKKKNLKIMMTNAFHMLLTIALNYQNIKQNPERKSKIKLLVNQYYWKEIDYLSHKKYWKKFESSNKSIALNIFYVTYNTEEIRHAYISKDNSRCDNQVILLMISGGKKWYYLTVKNYLHIFEK